MRQNTALMLLVAGLLWTANSYAKPENGQKFKDWVAVCEANPDTQQEHCHIVQKLTREEGEETLLLVRVGYIVEEKKPVAFIFLPLGVSLPGGAGLQIDKGEIIKFGYERCDANGCLAPLQLTDDLIGAMKAGNQARVLFFDATGKTGALPVSLLGFTAGFNSLE